MALVVFLRGVNVGGHRTFRPSILARELSDYDVVNVGAAGTFVVHKPGSRAKFRAELLRKLPFEAEVMLCGGRDLIRLEMENPFAAEPSRPDVVQFVSILSKAGGFRASSPITLPPSGEWLVRLIASKDRFVFGVYRCHMKTISYLGQVDKLFGVPATILNWNKQAGQEDREVRRVDFPARREKQLPSEDFPAPHNLENVGDCPTACPFGASFVAENRARTSLARRLPYAFSATSTVSGRHL